MLSSKLHEQLFSSVGEPTYSNENIKKSEKHLQQFDLGLNASEILEDIEFDLPPLESSNLNEHFKIIAQKQSKPYVDLIHQLIKSQIPPQPTKWKYAKGWTKFVRIKIIFRKIISIFFRLKRYSENDQTAISIDYPDEQVMVFDVETLVCEGNFAVLAVALSPNYWFVI
jgi:DNA polymerase gamma 1